MQALSLKLPLLHLFRSLHEKRCPQFFWAFSLRFVTVIYTPTRIHRFSRYIMLDSEMPVLSLKLPLLHLFRLLHEKKCLEFFWTFSLRFVTVIYTPTRIHRYSCYIVLGTKMQALSLKLSLLHLFRSLHEKRCPQFFGGFFVKFLYSDLYTHQNPLLLPLHSAGLRDACIIIETYMRKDAPNFLAFFITFRYSDLYTHQNPSLLSLHSAGHRDAGLIMETPFVTFVLIAT